MKMKKLHIKCSHSTKGFTLLEVVLSLSLLVILLSVIYSYMKPMITIYSTNQLIVDANELSERIIYQLNEMIEYREEVHLNKINDVSIDKARIGSAYTGYTIIFIDDDGHLKQSVNGGEITELFSEDFYNGIYVALSVNPDESTNGYLHMKIELYEESAEGVLDGGQLICSYPFSIRLFNAKKITIAESSNLNHMIIAYK